MKENFLKKLEWQDWALIVLIIIVAYAQFSIFSTFKQLPGPLYGGDYYHYGHVVHLYDGGSVFASSHYLGEYEHYPWLTHLLVSDVSKFIGSSPLNTIISLQAIITILSGIIIYILGIKIIKNKTIALLMALAWMVTNIPSTTPTGLGSKLLIPLTILAFAYTSSLKMQIVAGILYGLTGIEHVTAFLGISLFIVLFFIYRIYTEKKENKKTSSYEIIKKQVIFFIPIVVIGILIAMLYWGAPLFVYHGNTPNPWHEYTGVGVSGITFSYLYNTFKLQFFNTSSIYILIFSLITLLGLYFSVKKAKTYHLPLLVFLTGLIGILHPILTMPILGTSFGFYRFPMFFYTSSVIFFGVGTFAIYNSFRDLKAKRVIAIVLIIFLLLLMQNVYANYKEDQWVKVGQQLSGSTQAWFMISGFIRATTDVNDVFIATHGETAFALNALTGRKIVFMRRTHASPYVDANKRIADAAVILYGNNSELRRQLIEKYDVKYFIEDFYSFENIQRCIEGWNLFKDAAYADASYACLRVSPDYEQYLSENGIEFQKVHARMDVASNSAPLFDLLAIKPTEIKINITPIRDVVSADNVTIIKFSSVKNA